MTPLPLNAAVFLRFALMIENLLFKTLRF